MLVAIPLLYLVLIIGIGLSHRRGIDSQSSFFLARRSGNVYLITGSLLATSLGAFGVMGVSGAATRIGLVAGWYIWGGSLALVVLGAWAYKRLDVGDCYTLPELLGRRYGPAVRQVSAALISISWLSIIAAQLLAAGKILQFISGQAAWLPFDIGAPGFIIGVAVIFVAYTCVGGQHSVIRTDLIQAIIIVTGLIVLVAIVMTREPHLLGTVDREMMRLPFNESLPPSKWVVWMLTFGVPFLVGPDMYGRLFSAKNEQTARRSLLSAGMLMVPLFFLVVLAGVLSRASLGDQITDTETALLVLAIKDLGPLWVGLIVAALLSAVMSSADTCLITVSALVGRDLLGQWGLQPRDEKRAVIQGRIVVASVGFFSLLFALWFDDIVSALFNAYRVYSPSVLMPFLFLLIFPRHKFSPVYSLAAFVGGAAFAILAIATDSNALGYLAFLIPAIPLAGDVILNRTID